MDRYDVSSYWQRGIGVTLALRVIHANRSEKATSNWQRVGYNKAAGGGIEEFLLYVVFGWTALVLKD